MYHVTVTVYYGLMLQDGGVVAGGDGCTDGDCDRRSGAKDVCAVPEGSLLVHTGSYWEGGHRNRGQHRYMYLPSTIRAIPWMHA